jgi:hypothetical protein
MDDVQDVEATLRGTSDEFYIAVEALAQLERRKRSTTPADANFVQLSRDVVAAAVDVLRIAQEQERLAESVEASPVQDQLDPIEDVTPTRSLGAILDEWRAVERELAAVAPDSPEAAVLLERFSELRERYAGALARVRSNDGISAR